jgi:hypothetical protein
MSDPAYLRDLSLIPEPEIVLSKQAVINANNAKANGIDYISTAHELNVSIEQLRWARKKLEAGLL